MKRKLSPETIEMIEYCLNRGNAAITKVERGAVVVVEEKRSLVYKQRDEEGDPKGSCSR